MKRYIEGARALSRGQGVAAWKLWGAAEVPLAAYSLQCGERAVSAMNYTGDPEMVSDTSGSDLKPASHYLISNVKPILIGYAGAMFICTPGPEIWQSANCRSYGAKPG